jgi:hypothetical protein
VDTHEFTIVDRETHDTELRVHQSPRAHPFEHGLFVFTAKSGTENLVDPGSDGGLGNPVTCIRPDVLTSKDNVTEHVDTFTEDNTECGLAPNSYEGTRNRYFPVCARVMGLMRLAGRVEGVSLRVSGRNPAVPSNGGLFFRTGPALSPNLSLSRQFSAYFDPDLGLWTTTDADTIRPPSLPL